MILQRLIPDALCAIKCTSPIASQHGAMAINIQILAPIPERRELVPDPLLSKSKTANHRRPVRGQMAGLSPHAFPMQSMRPRYPRSIPSRRRPTLTEHRRTSTTCSKHKGRRLRPASTILASITTLHRV